MRRNSAAPVSGITGHGRIDENTESLALPELAAETDISAEQLDAVTVTR
jgi:hypothetical protein